MSELRILAIIPMTIVFLYTFGLVFASILEPNIYKFPSFKEGIIWGILGCILVGILFLLVLLTMWGLGAL